MTDVTVRFLAPHRGLTVGETGRYRPHKAEELIDAGVAVLVPESEAAIPPRPARREGREMVTVQVLQPFGGLVAGEEALYTRDAAQRLMNDGMVMLAAPPAAVKPPAELAKPAVPDVDKQARPGARRKRPTK